MALVAWLALGAAYAADEMPHPGRLAPATIVPSEVEGGAVATVGPGDTLYLTVYGQPELAAQVTLDVRGHIVVPFLGDMAVPSVKSAVGSASGSSALSTFA